MAHAHGAPADQVHKGVHLIEDNFVATFVDLFTVQQPVQKRVLQETVSNPFRRDTGAMLYTPPLPQWILASLRCSGPDSADADAPAPTEGKHRAIPHWDLDEIHEL